MLAVDCKLLIDPLNETLYPEQRDSVRMDRLNSDEFEFYNDTERGIHYVVFESSRYEDYALGAYMVVHRYNSGSETEPFRIDTVGDLSGEIKILKALKPSSAKYTPDHQTWSLMWRNAYSIPKGLTTEDLNVKIYKGLINSEGDSTNLDYQEITDSDTAFYLTMLGLDQYDVNGEKIPDNLPDERIEVFRPDWGLLIFPHRTPFDSDTTYTDKNGVTSSQLEALVPQIYDYTSNSEKTVNSVYYLEIDVTVHHQDEL